LSAQITPSKSAELQGRALSSLLLSLATLGLREAQGGQLWQQLTAAAAADVASMDVAHLCQVRHCGFLRARPECRL